MSRRGDVRGDITRTSFARLATIAALAGATERSLDDAIVAVLTPRRHPESAREAERQIWARVARSNRSRWRGADTAATPAPSAEEGTASAVSPEPDPSAPDVSAFLPPSELDAVQPPARDPEDGVGQDANAGAGAGDEAQTAPSSPDRAGTRELTAEGETAEPHAAREHPLAAALDGLAPLDRAALVLHDAAGLTVPELAAAWSIDTRELIAIINRARTQVGAVTGLEATPLTESAGDLVDVSAGSNR